MAGEPHGPFPISSLLKRPLWLRCLQSASLAAPGSFHKTRCKVIKDFPAPRIPLLKVSKRSSLCWGSPLQKTLKPPQNLSPARPTPLPQILRSFVKYFTVNDNNNNKNTLESLIPFWWCSEPASRTHSSTMAAQRGSLLLCSWWSRQLADSQTELHLPPKASGMWPTFSFSDFLHLAPFERDRARTPVTETQF